MSTRKVTTASPPKPVTTFWIDVLDHLPDDETTVLVAYDGIDVASGFMDGGVWKYEGSGNPIEGTVTHWADLPTHPEYKP